MSQKKSKTEDIYKKIVELFSTKDPKTYVIVGLAMIAVAVIAKLLLFLGLFVLVGAVLLHMKQSKKNNTKKKDETENKKK